MGASLFRASWLLAGMLVEALLGAYNIASFGRCEELE